MTTAALVLNDDSEQESIDAVLRFYEKALYVQAWARAQEEGALTRWRTTSGRVLVSRLLSVVGAPRQSRLACLRAFRADPQHPQARYFAGLETLHTDGPFSMLRFLRRSGEEPTGTPEERADWCLLHARLHAQLRDFAKAEEWVARAATFGEERPWLWVERAGLYDAEDRPEDALEAARRSLELRPWYRPGVLATADALLDCGREPEARALLEQADARSECAPYASRLATLAIERNDWAGVAQAIERFVALSPAIEAGPFSWACALRADAACGLGDIEGAIAFARGSQGDWQARLADRLEARPSGRRVVLPVPFVRQSHLTCGPATLTSIAKLWGRSAEHVDVTERICWNGTTAFNERRWAEENGWLAREFRVTQESAIALIDRGIPFTLTTVEPGSAHLQAVAGYVEHRGTLLLRDPSRPILVELEIAGGLERWRSTGPRGMVLVPNDRASLLEGVELPDAALYDRLYALEAALARHDREAAGREREALGSAAPQHPVTFAAGHAIGRYDHDSAALLATAEAALAVFPEDLNHLLQALGALGDLGRHLERRERLTTAVAKAHPASLLQVELAEELSEDHREHDRVANLLRRALRWRQTDSRTWRIQAGLWWSQGWLAEATDLYRIAACLDDQREDAAWSYFVATRHLLRAEPGGPAPVEAALTFLRDRVARFGRRSSTPARTLHRALRALNEAAAASEVLARALDARPDDGAMRLYAAEVEGEAGRFEDAGRALENAKGRVEAAAWERVAARLATLRGDPQAARDHWRRVVELEPLDTAAHEQLAATLRGLEGREAVRTFLDAAVKRAPQHFGLQRVLLGTLEIDAPPEALTLAQVMCEQHPGDAWIRREYALLLLEAGRHDEARRLLDEARPLEPRAAAWWLIDGNLRLRVNDPHGARQSYREAMRCDVGTVGAIHEWFTMEGDGAGREQVLAALEEELPRQPFPGEALDLYRKLAQELLAPERILATLRRSREGRPDLPETWSAEIRQISAMERAADAVALARRATDRFPVRASTWLDLAAAHAAAKQPADEREALEAALRLDPRFVPALRPLVVLLEGAGAGDEARRLVEVAVAGAPGRADLHQLHAEVLSRGKASAQALDAFERALTLAPNYATAWEAYGDEAWRAGLMPRAVAFARATVVSAAGARAPRMALADWLADRADADERLALLESALALDPNDATVHDLRAVALAHLGRLDEAFAAASPAIFLTKQPLALRGRRAWLLHEQGKASEAIADMKALLAEVPDYRWGAQRLIEWLSKAGDYKGSLTWANEVVRLSPRSAVALGWRADNLLKLGETVLAREALKSALALDDTYAYGLEKLFDLELESGRHAEARDLLGRLLQHSPGAATDARATEFAAARRGHDGARPDFDEAFTRLAESGTDDRQAIDQALAAGTKGGWGEVIDRVVTDAARSGRASVALVGAWARQLRHRKAFGVRDLIGALPAASPAREQAWGDYIEAFAPDGKPWILFWLLLWHAKEFARSVRIWGSVGYVLFALDWPRLAWRWLRDWRERPDVPVWAWTNVVGTALRCGHVEEARRALVASRAAPGALEAPRLRVWQAILDALDGRAREAVSLLPEKAELSEMSAVFPYCAALVRALALSEQGLADADRWRDTRAIVSGAERELPTAHTSSAQHVRLRALHLLRSRRGGLAAWFLWRK